MPCGPAADGAGSSGRSSRGPRSRPRAAASLVPAGALVVAAAYAGWASATAPFTVPADVAVSVPSAVFAAAYVLQWRWPRTWPWHRIETARPPRGGSAVPWLVVIGLLVACELASYFAGGSRAVHPTISSGINSLFHWQAAKAAGFLAWLSAGWYLVRR